MASGSSMPPTMRVARSSQSAAYTMVTGTWVTVYEKDAVQPFLFLGCSIDLSNMQAGDIIVVRVSKRLFSATTAYVIHDVMTYEGAQPASSPAISLPFITASLYGLLIEMQQTAGVDRSVTVETFDAFRYGLS